MEPMAWPAALSGWENRVESILLKNRYLFLSRIILASTNNDAWILDPFTGSSTTGIAANLLGRRFLGIDKEEEYLILEPKRKQEIEQPLTFSQFRKKIKRYCSFWIGMGVMSATRRCCLRL